MAESINAQIINILKTSNDYVTSDYLSGKLQVSGKTISRHISEINSGQETELILSKRGQGYKLNCDSYVQSISEASPDKTSVEMRQESITSALLLKAPSMVSTYQMIDKYFVSESIFQKDLKQIKKYLNTFNLQLVQSNHQIGVTGDEKNIRVALVHSILHVDEVVDLDTLASREGKHNKEDFNFVLEQLELANQMLNCTLPYPYNINFFSHIYVLLKRLRRFQYDREYEDECSDIQSDIVKNPEVYSVCQKIVQNIGSYLHQDSDKFSGEICYLFEYLVSSRFNKFNKLNLSDTAKAREISNYYVKRVSELYGTAFPSTLADEIEKHVLAMISRLKMEIYLPNALLSDTQLAYRGLFKAVKKASSEIADKYHFSRISDDESGFITLYFAKCLEQKKAKIRVYVVCTTGIGTSELIATKITNYWPDIEIAGVGSSRKILQILNEQKDIDLIISTVQLSGTGRIPVKVVSAFLTEIDKSNVNKAIEEIKSKY